MNNEPYVPTPIVCWNKLPRRIGEAEKVFFGACAGVGKTWAMLAEASDCGRKGWILWLAW